MNKVILVGRLTKDPELKTTSNDINVTRFTLAVTRRFKNQNGDYEADFISCVAWRSQAEFLCNYFQKGSRIGIVGTLHTRFHDDESGTRHYYTEVIINEIEFVESKRQQESYPPMPPPSLPEDGLYPTMDEDTSLPFEL